MRTKCTNCGGGSGVKAWCVQCVETLCQECVEAHKRVKVTRSHTILNQRPADSPKLDSASRPRFCPVHRQEVLQLYCFTCDQLTCRDCQIMNHRNHHFQFVHEAYQSIRKQMYHVLQTVDKHTEMAMKSIQDMSSRMQDIHSLKAKFKISIQKILQNFVQQFKQRLFQHYAEVMAVYKSEEEDLQRMMQSLLEKVEDHKVHPRKIAEDTDIKTLLAHRTEMENWSKQILCQDVKPPPSMTKVKMMISMPSWNNILAFGELQVCHVPFACNKDNSPEVLYLTAPKQPGTAGATTPTPSATSPTTFTKSSHLPHKHLPQTRNTNHPGPPDYWAEHFSVLGSARSNQPSFPPGQSNVRNAAPTTQSSPSSDFPPTYQTKHQKCSQQQTSNVDLSHQKTSNLGYSQSSQSNIGQAATTQSLPTCNYQRYSQAGSSHPGTNSSRSVVYNPRPLPPNQTAERTQSGAQTSMVLAQPASQPSYSLGVYPIGTNFFPIIGSGNTKQNQGSTTAGPNGNFVMVGAPIVSKQPTLVLNNHLPPINFSQKAVSGQLSRASTDTHPISTHPCSVTSFHQNTMAPLLNHTTPMASPSPAAEYSSSYSSGTSHDAVLPVRDLTHKQIRKATSVPSLPLTNPSNQQSPPAYKSSKSVAVIASNPLLYQIILHCPSTSGGTSGALTSDPEHTQPGNDHDSEPKVSPPIPQERPPTPKTVKALADSACDISPSQGLGEHLLAPNIQENELTSTVSDTRLIEDIPLIISELLTLWEDGGELSDSEDVAKPTDLGVQKTTPASPASLQCEDIHSETHREAGGTEATDVRPDVTNASSGSAGCSNKELAFVKTVSATSVQLQPMSEMLKNLEHSATPLKRRHSAQKLTNLRTSTDCQKQPGTNRQKKHGPNRQKYSRTNRRKKQPKDSGSVSSEPLSSSESSARPESPDEDSVSLEPLGDEPSKNGIREAGSGMALMGDPGSFSPVVSLVRLPISSFMPGRPLPRFFIHAGDREQELYLEEMVEDNVDDHLQPLSAPGSPDVNEDACACCRAPTCDVTCCHCERSFHTDCHVPPGVLNRPDWRCSVCQDLSDPRDPYNSERTFIPCLSLLDQRRCEHLLLCLLCLLCESSSTTRNPAKALGCVRDRLCHLQSPPYRTFSELVSDLQSVLNPTSTTESEAPSIWEGLQLSALVGDETHHSLHLDPGSQWAGEPPASPLQQTVEGPKVKMGMSSQEPTGSDTEGDPGRGPDEEEEDPAGPSSSPKERLKDTRVRWTVQVERKMKETRKRLKAFLETTGTLPMKKKRKHSQPDENDCL